MKRCSSYAPTWRRETRFRGLAIGGATKISGGLILRRVLCLVAMASAGFGPAARAQETDLLAPQIVHEPCEFYQKGNRLELMARFYDDSPIFDPKVIYRSAGETNWKNAPFTRAAQSEDFKAVIKARHLRGPLQYFIEAFDENGNGPARFGSPDAPISLKPSSNAPVCQQLGGSLPLSTVDSSGPEPPTSDPATRPRRVRLTRSVPEAPSACDGRDPPIYCSGWFWAVTVGAVVGGAGIAAYFLFLKEDTPPDRRDSIQLQIQAPDPTVGLELMAW